MTENFIRNFVIIAHIDHGKSTLADRLLEKTGTVEARSMKPQYLDQLELERERGITIKMAPVRMRYRSLANQDYILNLIDTPGHSDFGYEVSRALTAVEGAVLLVDATQGIQAQTLANFEAAQRAGLMIIGAVNKIDLVQGEALQAIVDETADFLGVESSEILKLSGKTGEGVDQLLERIVAKVPSPTASRKFEPSGFARGLVFDSLYDSHKGVLAFVRVFEGSFSAEHRLQLVATATDFKPKEVGYFLPKVTSSNILTQGEIGYLATGIKDPDRIKIGDTITTAVNAERPNVALPGYKEPKPVVFVALYPEDANQYDDLKYALQKLRLTDASLAFEPDSSEVLGRGFKGGFLGRLHFEIIAERLEREFAISTIYSFPSVAYRVRLGKKMDGDEEWLTITNPKDFPAEVAEVEEPVAKIEILAPLKFVSPILSLRDTFRFTDIATIPKGGKTLITARLPLADLIQDLDDTLKSISEGFASLNYELTGWQRADVQKLEIYVASNYVPGLTRILPKKDIEREARAMAEKLKDLLPKQQFVQAIQAMVGARVVARETIAAMKKDVTGYLYGGDRTRKMKLWKKQQEGKKRLKEIGSKSRITISATMFRELLKK